MVALTTTFPCLVENYSSQLPKSISLLEDITSTGIYLYICVCVCNFFY